MKEWPAFTCIATDSITHVHFVTGNSLIGYQCNEENNGEVFQNDHLGQKKF